MIRTPCLSYSRLSEAMHGSRSTSQRALNRAENCVTSRKQLRIQNLRTYIEAAVNINIIFLNKNKYGVPVLEFLQHAGLSRQCDGALHVNMHAFIRYCFSTLIHFVFRFHSVHAYTTCLKTFYVGLLE